MAEGVFQGADEYLGRLTQSDTQNGFAVRFSAAFWQLR